ncbi:Golgi-specific brefeldin A-resistance guanine nucleotide exchange factor 1-like isoform X1 [Dreissena polymorpha]|uniref:Golgi-specific brefeldin A-resistance guanine nucleotide exchange factor 1-like isoform X1 n=1 Tax=Dreissena polymorpha TaxID=45954 RepID=UPI002263B4CA|nr:Golgi-specific brefeldin A-resistance guanine nucleotide exchange factor 1-like isoform X1 [Dreissena polymorpha]XP_052237415.1 Golgi-specific brefeldin A-resistance guanine nucleotide exchange factor 1-like isoform X1 [Dreissena polymorpha]XP_052237416.1 Golgi-specific brefeldin A-resistance guanine nucleotide exchange factor 1-like isoform X1 [Dreissena polymorpha]XP_052237417.1 Golgi-specific brefeldin A-resistance guanine nucleotide exchange factor 1-like isoform X1 [Dreissena polymorpha]
MGSPSNGIYILQGEITLVVTAMRRSSRWSAHSQRDEDGDPLLSSFAQLKDVLNNITELVEIEPNTYLSPFLEVIRSEDTTGPITGLALTSINKFLSYGLVDPKRDVAAAAIENIADAVTHARFVGTDPGSDEVVLMKILHVLRTLLLCPAGVLLTNESVCEIMQSCFRICFEMRLSELLRRSAEHTLMDMVQLLFTRLPQFKEDPKWNANMKKLKMRTGGVDQNRLSRRKKSPKLKQKKLKPSSGPHQSVDQTSVAGTETDDPGGVGGAGERGQACGDPASRGGQSVPSVGGGADEPTVPGRKEGDTVSEGHDSGVEMRSREVVDPGVAYVEASRESICTTPVEGTTIIDIVKGFQDASDMESYNIHQEDSSLKVESLEGDDSLRRNISSTDFKEHISLAIPEEESLVRSASEVSLPVSQSDHGEEDPHSVTDCSGPTADSNDASNTLNDERVNPRGVRFIPHQGNHPEDSAPLVPYGRPCVRELFRFLVSLTNPLDRHNTDVMIHMGLSLLTVALESGADNISQFASLIYLVKDDMCRYLFMLVQSERLSLSAAALRVCFLLFESLRFHLKLQLEMYLTRLSEIITSDHPRITYEVRELALESMVQLWRIPGLVTELYLNYDCDLSCTNLFEDLTKLLSKNAFPVSGLFSTHLLSLDALLTVVDSIEQHCHSRILKATAKPSDEGSGMKSEGSEVMGSAEGQSHSGVKEDGLVGHSTNGFAMGTKVIQGKEASIDVGKTLKDGRKVPYIKPNRMKVTAELPGHDELTALKQRKRVYNTGTEYFNQKPGKGISYLQEQGLLADPLEPGEVVTFIRGNPKIDKKVLGEFITKRSNSQLLEAFVKSFHFEDLRIDEALRQYLEAFRLPGEAPVISMVMEHFADHWHKSNGEPFANAGAAFILSYAIIMLNVDQHNHNVKKQNIPMTFEQFKRNLSKTNGGEDFESEMLLEIYNAIKTEEIVMPSEHTGLVRENYLWKVMLKRAGTLDGVFRHAPTGAFDHDLFTLIWGPTVAALSFVFDKSSDEAIIAKAISGFRKCAMISAHYGMSDVFDNLVISLCKFTTLLSTAEAPENIPIQFGMNNKAQLAARTVFTLAHRHGDILREGWKNILDCMLQLYRAKLLPKSMIEVEDFIHPSGKICLVKEESQGTNQRSDTGVLSSFYSYFTMTESATSKGPTAEEAEATKVATRCIRECQLEQLIVDSKFLREESLHELIKALIFTSQGPEAHDSMGTNYDEDAAVFFFEQFITCILQNRDRVTPVWDSVKEHIYSLIVNAPHHTFMVERAVVGLLRISIRLLRREDIAPLVLSSAQILLMMKPQVVHSVSICQQVAYGLHEMLRTNAANIHQSVDWYHLFTLLEVVGAGVDPPPVLQVNSGVNLPEGLRDAEAQSDSEVSSRSGAVTGGDRDYNSDSEFEIRNRPSASHGEFEVRAVPENGSWMLVHKDEQYKRLPPVNQYSIELNEPIQCCDIRSMLKASETLSFLVRDAAHVTPLNFESCVHAIRSFAEASLNGGHRRKVSVPRNPRDRKSKHKTKKGGGNMKKSSSSPGHFHGNQGSDEEDEGHEMDAEMQTLSIQLLDLMHTLHTRASNIFMSWSEENKGTREPGARGDDGSESLWIKCWCPLLQGIARLCCDSRKQVRGQALTYLQRALLVHDLQTLSAIEWEACFNKILFPLLTKLLENINTQDPSGMEETRMRASTLLCKVFLQHLTPLLTLSTFTALWLTILDFMDKYMHADRGDLLAEAIPESLKNMLLVMDTAKIFQSSGGEVDSQLWRLTWDRISTFLPHLKDELFKPAEPEPIKLAMEREATPTPEAESSPLISGATTEQSSTQATDGNSEHQCDPPLRPTTTVTSRPSSPDNSFLATETELPIAAPYFLHTPLPILPSSGIIMTTLNEQTSTRNAAHGVDSTLRRSPSEPVLAPAVPLLLNPDLMKDGQPSARLESQTSSRRSTSPTHSPQHARDVPVANYPMNRVHDI